MAKFVTKPRPIMAERFFLPEGRGSLDGVHFREWPIEKDEEGYYLSIPARRTDPKIEPGEYRVDIGDWIVTEADGEQYPVTNENFVQTYDPEGGDIPGSNPFTEYPYAAGGAMLPAKEQ